MKMILFCHISKEKPNASALGAFNQALSSGATMAEAKKAASEAVKYQNAPRSGDMEGNIQKAKNILKANNIDAEFSGYSEAHGVSVYFKDGEGNKIRVSTHGVTNTNRVLGEKHFSFPMRKLSLGTKLNNNKETKESSLNQSIIKATERLYEAGRITKEERDRRIKKLQNK